MEEKLKVHTKILTEKERVQEIVKNVYGNNKEICLDEGIWLESECE